MQVSSGRCASFSDATRVPTNQALAPSIPVPFILPVVLGRLCEGTTDTWPTEWCVYIVVAGYLAKTNGTQYSCCYFLMYAAQVTKPIAFFSWYTFHNNKKKHRSIGSLIRGWFRYILSSWAPDQLVFLFPTRAEWIGLGFHARPSLTDRSKQKQRPRPHPPTHKQKKI